MNPVLKWIVAKQRKDFAQLAAGKSVPVNALDGVIEERDIPYKNDSNPSHTMDLYCPKTCQLPTPVVINIHGGGLIMGNKEFNRHFCAKLCQMGFLVFSVEYRLCPEVTVFQQLDDIYRAMDCIDRLLPGLGAIPGQCYMAGDSAGAMLSLYAAAIQGNPRQVRVVGLRPSHLKIKALGLISGMFYTTRMDSIGLLLAKAFYGKHYKMHPFYPYLNPSKKAVSGHLPPCLLVTSRHDHLHRYTYDLVEAIRKNGGSCILRDYGPDPKLCHAFPVFEPEYPESETVVEDLASFFLDTL